MQRGRAPQPPRAPRHAHASRGRERGARDADAQTEVALRAFVRGSVLLLIDDKQVDHLDAEVVLTPGSTVSFLQLVPLVGG